MCHMSCSMSSKLNILRNMLGNSKLVLERIKMLVDHRGRQCVKFLKELKGQQQMNSLQWSCTMASMLTVLYILDKIV